PLGLLLLGMQLERIVVEWSKGRGGVPGIIEAKALEEQHSAEADSSWQTCCIEAKGAACRTEEAATLFRDVRDGIAAGALRIIGGFIVSFALVQVFDFGPSMNQVLILQSSMPTAVNMVVYATEWDCRPRIVSAAILSSTLASTVSVSLILKILGA
ncbi:MAG: AEC family transporter, partial [candidate division WOR-3 bacterium]